MTTETYRIPDVDDLPAGIFDDWDDVDPACPDHRLMVALHRHRHLVAVPEWEDLGAWRRNPVTGAWSILTAAGGLLAEASPIDRRQPDGEWELFVEHVEWETVTAESEADLRWTLGVLVWLDALAVDNDAPERRCRECGCTDLDCSGCIERTGVPCSWAARDLCTACVPAPVAFP